MKLKTPEFKVGQEVWSIKSGFGVLIKTSLTKYPLLLGAHEYMLGGRLYENDTHRSLFTLDEAEQLFGAVKEKKKKVVVMYQALYQIDFTFMVSFNLYESEADFLLKHTGATNLRFIKLLTDRPIEVEVNE